MFSSLQWVISVMALLHGTLFPASCVNHTPENGFAYHLSQPDEKFSLPKQLKEISGLAWVKGHKIACVQDEDGKLFIYDWKKEALSQKFGFGKDADYEGIAIVHKKVWVLRSNGNLLNLEYMAPDAKRKTYKTKLTPKNNTEGLCYDEQNKRLLISCKDHPGKKNKSKQSRAIYAFDLVTRKLKTQPAFLIDCKALRDSIRHSNIYHPGPDSKFTFKPGKGGDIFRPSGLAIHPLTGDVFIVSAVGKLLVVLHASGKVKAIVPLHEKIFKQPEGITFDKRGNLFISNEGRNGKANILKFSPLETK